MKKKFNFKLSNSAKAIIGALVLLAVVIISSYYNIDLGKYLKNFNNFYTVDKENEVKDVTLVKCIDGDTVKLKENGKTSSYRFLGIDTPEVTKGEKYSKEAKNFTCDRLKNANEIKVEYEKDSANKDKYKRKLAWIFVDGKLLQEELILNGYAKVRYVYVKLTYIDKLYNAQKKAIKNKINVFENYEKETYNKEKYNVLFDYKNHVKEFSVSSGTVLNVPENPIKNGYKIKGWKYNDTIIDFSKPIVENMVLEPVYTKNT